MFCPNCGKELPDSVRFCAHCGKAVSFETQQPQKQIVGPNMSSENTSQDSYCIEENVQQQKSTLLSKKKSKGPKIIIGLASLILIILICSFAWLTINFPGAELNDFLASSVTSTLPLGSTFSRNDFSFTPIEVSYVSSGVGYDDYGEPYATIMLDITCLSGKWRPKFDDIAFWLNGDYALSHKYTDTEIKRGETERYTFTHPLFTSSTKDVSMQLTVECLTGATVNLYFPVDGVSEFFNGNNYQSPTNEGALTTQPNSEPFTNTMSGDYDDIAGTYIDEYGFGFYMFIGYEDSSKQAAYANIALVMEDVLVKLERDGNFVSGSDFYRSIGSAPSQIVEMIYSPGDGIIIATIYTDTIPDGDTIRFVPCPNAPYSNPFYVG